MVVAAAAVSIALMFALKAIYDYVRPRRAELLQRYSEVAGRIAALYVGTVSVDMIMRGIQAWVEKF